MKLFSCLTQLTIKFILLIIVDILSFISRGELHLSGNHTVTEYIMSGNPCNQKNRWINHSNEQL